MGWHYESSVNTLSTLSGGLSQLPTGATDEGTITSDAGKIRPVGSRTVTDVVYQTVREAILGGVLREGEKLRLNDLAVRLQVSTTPVREALRSLAKEGLVTIEPHSGAVVTQIDADEMEELYLIRTELESLALRMAAKRLRSEDLTTLHDILLEIREAAARKDSDGVRRLTRTFHQTACSLCELPHLLNLIDGLQEKRARYEARGEDFHKTSKAYEDHLPLYQKLEERDPRAIDRCVRNHYRVTTEAIKARMKQARGEDATKTELRQPKD